MRQSLMVLSMMLTLLGAAGADCTAEAREVPSPAEINSPPATVADLVRKVEIPYAQFTLANGLRVLVHEDRKAPVVAVSVWYNVGSKDEPPGRTGFAHLFEHLMFNGSENAPGDYFEPLREIGATDFNGTTWFDRTNYFQTVPRPALERVLFLESDRMGHLLGAVSQETLANQVSVVQNEKRQGDNQPFGLVEYAQLAALFPEDHPYRHATIGSMADLDAATLDDVRSWFRAKYGPNNAVLVLAGDLSASEARPLVEKYFGEIPRGPENRPAVAPVPTLAAPVTELIKDPVANTRLYRNWAVPGLLDGESAALTVAAGVLGGLSSSRLDNELVRKDQTAVRVSAEHQTFHRVGIFEVQVDVKPGADADAVARRVDEILAELIAKGPTEDEVQRVVMTEVAARIRGLEQVGGFGGKAAALAEGALYANDPEFYRKRLLALGRVTPADVRQVLRKWLMRPVYALSVVPGERGPYEEAAAARAAQSSTSRQSSARAAVEAVIAPSTDSTTRSTREPPPVGQIADLDFPQVEHARLSNGIEVVYARRQTVPVIRLAAEFDAGVAADPATAPGAQLLMLRLLQEGTTSRSSVQIAEEQERLGAQIQPAVSRDRSAVLMAAMTPNLGPSLDLLADIIRNPAFTPAEVERLRAQQIALIAEELTQPSGLAQRALPPLIYGPEHPYGQPPSGTGRTASIKAVQRGDLIRVHQSWIRPDTATIFAVGDIPLPNFAAELERRFGDWRSPALPKGAKRFAAEVPSPMSRIVLIDRPQSPQSYIYAGQVLPARGSDDTLALRAANEVLGGNFLSRINMDLRETKGWSYGARSSVDLLEDRSSLLLVAPVQADKTGAAVQALMNHVRGLVGGKGVTPVELQQVINANTRQLAGQFETSAAVLGALRSNALYRRPDDYWEKVAGRYRTMTAQQLDTAARAAIDPARIVWVVVGDVSKVRGQFTALGLPVELGQPE
ncbi:MULTISPECIES: M16 family metallopeptidase [Pseudomonadota]|uniref:M16 family metallopeptidase n=1 Tax=Pseudomonadota TaxID=1224 RepID=UPI00076AB1AB|nr:MULTISPECIES: pitrilysin family protein [Pseudomonadota]